MLTDNVQMEDLKSRTECKNWQPGYNFMTEGLKNSCKTK